MSQNITVTGMILSATPMGEYDKRIVILTKERGKLSAFAKGSRRPNSHLAGAVNPFSFGVFTLYEGRNSYTIQQAEISNYFAELRTDMESAYYGFYFLEFADYYTREHNDELMMLKLLYQTMRILIKRSIPPALIRCIYELKAICINGEAPQVFECVLCQKKEELHFFSARAGGVLCESCRYQTADAMPVSQSTLYTLQYIVGAPIEKLYTFKVNEKVLGELKRIVERYVDVYIGKQFKSLEILDTLLG